MKIVVPFSNLITEEILLMPSKRGEDLDSSVALNTYCLPHVTVLEEVPRFEGLEVLLDVRVAIALVYLLSKLLLHFE